jgi:hypothetical protein
MNNTDYLLSFLLNYDIIHEFGTIDNLLNIIGITQTALPKDLLMVKFFEYALFKNKTVDEIYDLFNTTGDYSTLDHDKEIIGTMLAIVGSRNSQFIPFNMNNAKKKIAPFLISLKNKDTNDVPHTGQPYPDPIKGRPHLQWCYCQYSKCKKEFNNPIKLVEHLTKCNAYSQGYHYYHEVAVHKTQLTPEKVIAQNLTKCPSYACDHKEFSSCAQLNDHLARLGIEPFWTQGMTFDDEIDFDKNNMLTTVPKMFVNEFCVVCLVEPCSVLINNCRHHVYCLTCHSNKNIINKMSNICPACRTKVDQFIPFA